MKKKHVNLKKLELGKSVVSRLNSTQIKGRGEGFSRYSCEFNCIPPFDVTLNQGCQFNTVGCPGPSANGTCEWNSNCICDSIITCQVC